MMDKIYKHTQYKY